MYIIFTRDFANNWKIGDKVPIKILDKDWLVDDVALFEKSALIGEGDIYDDDGNIIFEGDKTNCQYDPVNCTYVPKKFNDPNDPDNSPKLIKTQLKRILTLEGELQDRIHNYINEYCLRDKMINPDAFKNSLLYIIDNEIDCLKQNI